MSKFYTLQYSTPSQGPFKIFGCNAENEEVFLKLFEQHARSEESPDRVSSYLEDYEEYVESFEEPISFVEYIRDYVLDNDSDCPHSIFEWDLE